MKTGEEKYREVIKALKNSAEDPLRVTEIEEAIIRSVSEPGKSGSEKQGVLDFIFGWIWIGWVRTSLITASFCLVIFFVWQQNNILNKIEKLQSEIRQNDRMITYNPSLSLERKLLLNRISEDESLTEKITIDRSDLLRMIDSLEIVQNRYRNIMELIGNDPALKKAVEQKLGKSNKQGLNL
ncbi:MAG TPA: hypothetical protein VK155_11180 [Bacteroidales bacterium]|nr:hypothetical protein [Bacteroidales bacterium]